MKMTLRKVPVWRPALLFAGFRFLVSSSSFYLLLLPTTIRPDVEKFFYTNHLVSEGHFYSVMVAQPFESAFHGLITGLLAGWLYNLWARWSGGLQFELAEAAEHRPAEPVPSAATESVFPREKLDPA